MHKKREIVKAAIRLFAGQGFDSTTTLQITLAAGATEPSLYYHFKGKDDLYLHIIHSIFAEYLSRLDALKRRALTPFEKIEQLVILHFQFADERPDEACLVINIFPAKLKDPDHLCAKNVKEIEKWLTDFIATCLKDGILSGEFNTVPVETTADFIIAMINGLLRQHALRREHRAGMRETAIEFCRRSLVKDTSEILT